MTFAKSISFEKVMKFYLLFGLAIAFAIPKDFAIEQFISFDPRIIPYAKPLLNIGGRLPSLTTFFFLMWMIFPIVFWLMATNPFSEDDRHVNWSILKRCIIVSVCDLLILPAMIWVMYMPDVEVTPYMARGTKFFHLIAMYRPTMGLLGGLLMTATALIANIVVIRTPILWVRFVRG